MVVNKELEKILDKAGYHKIIPDNDPNALPIIISMKKDKEGGKRRSYKRGKNHIK